MKIIAITGHKNSNKDLVAMRLASNSDVVYIRPYSDKKRPLNMESYEEDDYIHLNNSQLSYKMEREEPFLVKEIDGVRYVFFMTQFRADFCAIIIDKTMLDYLKKNWDGEIVSIYCHDGRGCDDPKSYDIIYDWKNDDFDRLESDIIWFLEKN